MKVAGIIVNYRTGDMTARAVDALLRELATVGPHHVYVVDNDSRDDSLSTLERERQRLGWGERVSVLAAQRNGGYGYGINLAIERASAQPDAPEYFHVINSDAFPDAGSIERLVAFMDESPDVGLAGSHVHGPDGESQGAAFRFPSIWSELETTAGIGLLSRALARHVISIPAPRAHTEVDWLPGTSLLLRKRAVDEVGLFDEAFFLYFEEVDYCRRLHRAGWKCCYVADAPITHIGCVSTGMLDHERPMPRYWFSSRHRYFLKHHGRAYAAASDAAWLAGQIVGTAKRKATGRGRPERPNLVRDFVTASLRELPFTRAPRPDESQVESKTSRGASVGAAAADRRGVDQMSLLELVAEDFATYGGDLTQPGLWAVLVHRMGRRAERLDSSLARNTLGHAYQAAFTAVDWVWGIHLPKSVKVGRRVRLWHNGCMLLCAREIGDDVHIRHDTTFGPARARDPEELPVIEDGVDIGSGVCVLGSVTVGHDARIGANSVVLKNVPASTMVLGVPARIVPA